MSIFALRLAAGLTRAWVRLYTFGLPPERREQRRAEIDCDLWEQESDAQAVGSKPEVTATKVFSRWIMGVPSDLSWRIDRNLTSKGVGRERRLARNAKGQTALMRIAALMAALAVIVVVSVSFDLIESHASGYDTLWFVWGAVGVSAGAMILVQFTVISRLPM